MNINKKKFDQYLNNQNLNFINRYLHSIRYKYIYEIFKDYQNSIDRKINIVDIGCGHAHLFDILNSSFNIEYVGIDKSPRFTDHLESMKNKNNNFNFINDYAQKQSKLFMWADIIVSLETFEHVPDDQITDLITEIGRVRPDIFFSSVPNEVGPIVWIKNIYSALINYDRHKEYNLKDTFFSGIGMFHLVREHKAGHRGFDWRKLYKLINKNYEVSAILTSPYKFVPKMLSPSIYFVCKNI